jgi:hypothetical protein
MIHLQQIREGQQMDDRISVSFQTRRDRFTDPSPPLQDRVGKLGLPVYESGDSFYAGPSWTPLDDG